MTGPVGAVIAALHGAPQLRGSALDTECEPRTRLHHAGASGPCGRDRSQIAHGEQGRRERHRRLLRFVAALVLVCATCNPEGISFYHWVIEPLRTGVATGGPMALKFLAGIVLLIGGAIFVQATRRSLGIGGVMLVAAAGLGVLWLLIEVKLLSPASSRAIGHVVLIVTALILATGMTWSHLSRKFSGQVDTDDVAWVRVVGGCDEGRAPLRSAPLAASRHCGPTAQSSPKQ
jgi:putative flippase GtrA